VDIKEVAEKIWLVTFMQYDLGFRSRKRARSMRAESVRAKGVTHVSGIKRYPSHRNRPIFGWLPRPDSKSIASC
jgi:hypothetical protein